MLAGDGLGLRNAGYRAIETLLLEKGYRAWGAEIGSDHTSTEAGLAWACKMKSGVDFIGRAAVAGQLARGVKKRLAGFTVDDPTVILLERETIYRNDERVGWLSSGGFGHAVGKPIGYGFVRRGGVDAAFLISGSYELEVASERIPARLHPGALNVPTQARIKARGRDFGRKAEASGGGILPR